MASAVFDDQPTLAGPTLALRPLTASDFTGLYAAASHPRIWAGHPARDRPAWATLPRARAGDAGGASRDGARQTRPILTSRMPLRSRRAIAA